MRIEAIITILVTCIALVVLIIMLILIKKDLKANKKIPLDVKKQEEVVSDINRLLNEIYKTLNVSQRYSHCASETEIIQNYENGYITKDIAENAIENLRILKMNDDMMPALINSTKRSKNKELLKLEALYEKYKVKKTYRKYDTSKLERIIPTEYDDLF